VDEAVAFQTPVLERLSEAGAPLTLKGVEARVFDLTLTSTAGAGRTSSK
jgi:hypothetical protein